MFLWSHQAPTMSQSHSTTTTTVSTLGGESNTHRETIQQLKQNKKKISGILSNKRAF